MFPPSHFIIITVDWVPLDSWLYHSIRSYLSLPKDLCSKSSR